MKQPHKCIFCLAESTEFNTIEHIIPESLGNTEDILVNAVCDKCQNYFGKEVENYVLSKTPFGFWRTVSGTLNKKGKKPFFNGTQLEKNARINDYHEFSDKGMIFYPSDNETVIGVDIDDEKTKSDVLSGIKTTYNLVLTPKMLIYMGRFLGKIALEYWHKEFGSNVFDSKFDEIRKYVRYGTTKHIWPILNGKLDSNLLIFHPKNKFEEERTLYAYRFYEIDGQVLFCLNIGSERYSIILTEKYPNGEIFTDKFLSALCEGTNGLPNIFYYNL